MIYKIKEDFYHGKKSCFSRSMSYSNRCNGRTVCKYIGCRTWNDRNQRSSQKSGRFSGSGWRSVYGKCYPGWQRTEPGTSGSCICRNPEWSTGNNYQRTLWIRSSLCKPCSEADRSWRCRYHRCRWYGKYDNGSVHVEKRTLWISYGKCDNRRCYDQGWSDRCIP